MKNQILNAKYLSLRMIHTYPVWAAGKVTTYMSEHAALPLPSEHSTFRTALVCLTPPREISNTVKHLPGYCFVPQISTGSYNEDITHKMKLHVGKTCLITKVGATPPITMSVSRKGAATLTHSLFGRYSASLSFPLVSPEKREFPFVLPSSRKYRRMRAM